MTTQGEREVWETGMDQEQEKQLIFRRELRRQRIEQVDRAIKNWAVAVVGMPLKNPVPPSTDNPGEPDFEACQKQTAELADFRLVDGILDGMGNVPTALRELLIHVYYQREPASTFKLFKVPPPLTPPRSLPDDVKRLGYRESAIESKSSLPPVPSFPAELKRLGYTEKYIIEHAIFRVRKLVLKAIEKRAEAEEAKAEDAA
jgi:hypothetical protein